MFLAGNEEGRFGVPDEVRRFSKSILETYFLRIAISLQCLGVGLVAVCSMINGLLGGQLRCALQVQCLVLCRWQGPFGHRKVDGYRLSSSACAIQRSGGLRCYLIEMDNGKSDPRRILPAIIYPLGIMIEELLQSSLAPLAVQVEPFLTGMDTKPIARQM